jgi:hypothetical protein
MQKKIKKTKTNSTTYSAGASSSGFAASPAADSTRDAVIDIDRPARAAASGLRANADVFPRCQSIIINHQNQIVSCKVAGR